MTWAFIRKLLGRGRVPRSVGGTRAAGRARARTTIPIVTGSQPIVLAARPSMTIRQLPLAAQRALAMLGDEASTASLALLFEKDPAITQSLLVRANSAYYNPTGKRVLSMSNAITRLGHGGVRNVLIQNSLQGLVCRPGGALDAMVEQAWSHMVRTAPLARAIAPDFGVDGEKAFALGLLHDVGKLVTFDRLTASGAAGPGAGAPRAVRRRRGLAQRRTQRQPGDRAVARREGPPRESVVARGAARPPVPAPRRRSRAPDTRPPIAPSPRSPGNCRAG